MTSCSIIVTDFVAQAGFAREHDSFKVFKAPFARGFKVDEVIHWGENMWAVGIPGAHAIVRRQV